MIAKTRTTKTLRNVAFGLALTLIGATSAANSSAQAQTSSPPVTGVIVILVPKSVETRETVRAVMPAEIWATLQLYLTGKIREWDSRSDGRGAVSLVDTRDITEAQTIMDGLPLGKENLMDREDIAVGPLLPLGLLIANPAPHQ